MTTEAVKSIIHDQGLVATRSLAMFKTVAFAVVIASTALSGSISAQRPQFGVTLLGTGDPIPDVNRSSAAIVVNAGDEHLLFDAGRGVMVRLSQIGQRNLGNLFLTHLHSDHVVGLPDLWLTGWLMGRDTPLRVWGPEGTVKLLDHLQQALLSTCPIASPTIGVRPQAGPSTATNIDEGTVYESNGVRVSAFLVDHRPITPAFGYRIDFDGRCLCSLVTPE